LLEEAAVSVGRNAVRIFSLGGIALVLFGGMLAAGVSLRGNQAGNQPIVGSDGGVPRKIVRLNHDLSLRAFGLTVRPLAARRQPKVRADRAIAIGMPNPPTGPTSITANLGAIKGDPIWVIEYDGVCTPVYGPVQRTLGDCPSGTMYVVLDGENGDIIEIFTESGG
jgi:hypothetical protein